MKINIFEGSRRITRLVYLISALIFIWFVIDTFIYFKTNYSAHDLYTVRTKDGIIIANIPGYLDPNSKEVREMVSKARVERNADPERNQSTFNWQALSNTSVPIFKIQWSEYIKKIGVGFGILIGWLFLLWIGTRTIGWIFRGFLGIPSSRDFRPEGSNQNSK